MDNKSDVQFLIMQATIEVNKQYCGEKMKKLTEDLTAIITSIMDQINISKSSLDHKDSPKPKDPTNLFPNNRRAPSLEGGHYTKLVACGLSNMISSHQSSMNS